MAIENPVKMIRMLKGAPISVLFSLMLAKQPMGLSWLISVTGYSQNPVRQALAYLVEAGLVQRNGRCEAWVLTGEAKQLPLMPDQIEGETLKRVSKNDTRLTTTTTTIEGSSKSWGSSSRMDDRVSINDTRINLLHEAGIGEPKASQLCRLTWMSEEYIRAHLKKARIEGTEIPLLIFRMQMQDAAPVFNGDETWIDRARRGAERNDFVCPDCLCSPCHCNDA